MLLDLGWPQGAQPTVSELISHILDCLDYACAYDIVNLCGETEEVICGGAATRDRALLEPVESGHDAGLSAPLTALQLRHILTHTSADSPIAQLWHERCLAAQTRTAWRSRLWRGEHVDAREGGGSSGCARRGLRRRAGARRGIRDGRYQPRGLVKRPCA